MALTIRDETATGRPTGTMELDVPDVITLRDLIRLRVREEVARYNAQPAERFRGLVRPRDAEEDLNGYRMLGSRRIDWERQADGSRSRSPTCRRSSSPRRCATSTCSSG
jgi:hypothetical protein